MKNHDDGKFVLSISLTMNMNINMNETKTIRFDALRSKTTLHAFCLFSLVDRYTLQNPLQSVIIIVLLTIQPTYIPTLLLPLLLSSSSSDGNIHTFTIP